MSDFFDRLEHELRRATVRASLAVDGPDTPAAVRHSRARSTAGGLLVAFGSVAAIVVAIIAIAVTGHGSHGQAPLARSLAGSSCTRRMLGELGVLRRPQTPADRAFVPPMIPTGGKSSLSKALSPSSSTSTLGGNAFSQTVVPGLTRLARELPDGRRVFFVIYRPPGVGVAASGGDVIWVFITGPGTSSAAPAALVLPELLSSRHPQQPPIENSNIYFSVVPDGVARVKWTYPRLTIPRIKLPDGRVYPQRVIPGTQLTANVQGNVAAVEKPRRPLFEPSATTWLAADGHATKTFRYPVSSPPRRIPASGTITQTMHLVGTPVPSNC